MREIILAIVAALGTGGLGVAWLDRRYRHAVAVKTISETKVIDVTAADAIVAASKGAVVLVTERMDAMAKELSTVRTEVTDLRGRVLTAEERAEQAERKSEILEAKVATSQVTIRRLGRRVEQLIRFLKDHNLEPPQEQPDYPEETQHA